MVVHDGVDGARGPTLVGDVGDAGRHRRVPVARRRRRPSRPRHRSGGRTPAPIPDAAPVTSATLPSRRPTTVCSLKRVLVVKAGDRPVKFALFYEIPVARPWDAAERVRRVPEHARAGGARRQAGLPLVLDRRAPLPRGVLALLQPRGALRRHRGADREHAPRLRRAPAAQAVQPPDPHRGVGGGARPDLSDGRVEFGTGRSSTRGRDRGLRHRPAATRARCGARRSSTSSAAGRTRSTSSTGKHWRMRGRARAAEAAAEAAPAAVGRDEQRRRAPRDRRATASGCARSPSACPPEELAERIAIYREGLAECKQPVGKFVNDQAATFTMVHCAPTNEEAYADAEESFVWYVQDRRAPSSRSVADWHGEGKDLGTYQLRRAHGPDSTRTARSTTSLRLPPRRAGASVVGDPDGASRLRSATRPPAATCCSAS